MNRRSIPVYIWLIMGMVIFTCIIYYDIINTKLTGFFFVTKCTESICSPTDLTKIGALSYGFLGALIISSYFYHKTITPVINRIRLEFKNIRDATNTIENNFKDIIDIINNWGSPKNNHPELDKKLIIINHQNEILMDVDRYSRNIITSEHRKFIKILNILVGEFIQYANKNDLRYCKTIYEQLKEYAKVINKDMNLKGLNHIKFIVK